MPYEMSRRRRSRRFRRLLSSLRRLLSALGLLVRRRGPRFWALTVLSLVVLGIVAGSEPPPRHPEDLCAIFTEKRSWYRSSRAAARDWGVPEAVQMAILYQESAFRATARPPRRKILWILPGPRPSSAYGFGQALDDTWELYKESVGEPGADRHDFSDVADFVGWYVDHIHRSTGVAKDDARRLYLAYHEGPGGYRAGTHRGKTWLLETARRVAARAERYERQYADCATRLLFGPWLVWGVMLVLVTLALWAAGGGPSRLSRRAGRPGPS